MLVITLFTACTSNGKYVSRGAAYKTLSYGQVTAKEEVTIGGSNSGIGSYIGAAAAIEDATSRSFLGFIVRGLAGSVVGATAEEVVTRKDGMLYTVETSRGNTVEIASRVKDLEVGACILISNARNRQVKVKEAPQAKCLSGTQVTSAR